MLKHPGREDSRAARFKRWTGVGSYSSATKGDTTILRAPSRLYDCTIEPLLLLIEFETFGRFGPGVCICSLLCRLAGIRRDHLSVPRGILIYWPGCCVSISANTARGTDTDISTNITTYISYTHKTRSPTLTLPLRRRRCRCNRTLADSRR
jgi:hypothetical protein